MNFVFVPGAWHGGWSWYPVGHQVLVAGHTALALISLPQGARGRCRAPWLSVRITQHA
jgi:hypothetical protein